MATSVLGKRARAQEEGAEGTLVTTRSKRRIVLNAPNDENENPFHTAEQDGEVGDEADLQTAKDAGKKTRRVVGTRTASSKHRAPRTIGSHFKVGKSTIPVFEDGKNEQRPPPATPSHRHLPSKVPITPRHRLILAGAQTTPRTPKTPGSPSGSTTAVYNQARQLFSRCSNPGRLTGRDDERKRLSHFISTAIDSKSGGCLYISGPPGTGKSALVHEVARDYNENPTVSRSTVNCMSVKTAKDLSGKLSEDLGLNGEAGFEYLKSCFIRGKAKDSRKYVVILDEVDRLVDLDLELLYNFFAWSMQPSSRLILIGIANALDLTDRFLPRLKSRSLNPQLLPFMPYSAGQIAEVLTSKLRSLSGESQVPFLHPAAIQFCAKKVAGQTGDLRKAFDICRRAIDLVEQETREKDARLAVENSPSKTPLMENINLSSPPTPRSIEMTQTKTPYTMETAPKATIAHIAKVTALVFGNGTTQRLATLNVQQKAVLCALAALEKRKQQEQASRAVFATPSKHNSAAAPSIKQLFDAYCNLCKRESLLQPLTNTEFRDVVSGLEALSLLSPVEGKGGSFAVPLTPSRTPGRKGRGGFGTAAVAEDRKIASAVSWKELSGALEGSGGELLREILEGDLTL